MNGWIELTMLDGDHQRSITIKKSWIIGVVDMSATGGRAPTALLLGNHGLPMVSIMEESKTILEQLNQ